MLVVGKEFDCVCHKSRDEKYVIGCLERGVRLFRGLIDGKCNNEQNQVLADRFRSLR